MYHQGEKVVEKANEYRVGNRSSKVISKNSLYSDFELGIHDSLFNEIKRKEGFVHNHEVANFCRDRNLIANETHIFKPSNNDYKVERLKYIKDNLVPFGKTIVHAYLLSRGIIEKAIPEETIYHIRDTNPDLLAHRIVDVNNQTIGFQTFKVTPELKKIKPPSIYGSCKGGKTIISQPTLEEIILVEGLEDGLTVHQSFSAMNINKTVWVMVGTGNFLNVEIPKETQKITLALDNDDAGNKVVEKATQRFADMGLSVSRIRPEKHFKDFNDELRGITK